MLFLSPQWSFQQDLLIGFLEDELGELSQKQREFITVCELADLESHMKPFQNHWFGRDKIPRIHFAKAFVAKAVYNLPTTKDLIEHLKSSPSLHRLCGWQRACDVPSEATFSRAFDEFALAGVGDVVHAAMIKNHYGDKVAGHISRDATAIEAREKAAPKEKVAAPKKPKRKRGRPRKGEVCEPKETTRIEKQGSRSLAENLDDLPKACDFGTKRNSQGKSDTWKGYKLHIDCVDGDLPVSAVLTSASVHDSQVAIPLAQMSADRLTNLYDLADSAYDAKPIHDFSKSQGHVPIIDHNPRRGQVKRQMAPAEKVRYKERSSVERVNSTLKDNYGGRHVRVRGHAKVTLHLMFGLIAICANQLVRLLE